MEWGEGMARKENEKKKKKKRKKTRKKNMKKRKTNKQTKNEAGSVDQMRCLNVVCVGKKMSIFVRIISHLCVL